MTKVLEQLAGLCWHSSGVALAMCAFAGAAGFLLFAGYMLRQAGNVAEPDGARLRAAKEAWELVHVAGQCTAIGFGLLILSFVVWRLELSRAYHPFWVWPAQVTSDR